MTSQSYPVPPNSLTGDDSGMLGLTYQYDSMARLTTMGFGDQTTTATYGPAGELTSLGTLGPWGSVQETRTYNSLLQLTQIQSTGSLSQNIQYVYSATQNNGRITQTIDAVSGEQVSYQYDALNRLMHAETAGNTWGETYQYDGFGNLTVKTPTKGSAPAWSASYNAATNWQMGVQYDANGNPPVGTFDVENRLVSEIDPSTGDTLTWLYDPWGKRVGRMHQPSGGQPDAQYTLYGVTGQRLAVLGCTSNGQWWTCATSNSNVYFKGRLLMKALGGYMSADRLGSVGTGSAYFPYGEEKGSPPTPTGVERFGTYYRDFVGQDYADQRYYNSIGGRFLTPDPGGIRTADPKNPGSWNRYAYAYGDPVNYYDPSGEFACNPDFCDDDEEEPEPVSDPVPPQRPATPKPPVSPDCDRTKGNNALILDFISSHLSDAKTLAAELNDPVQFVLGLSAEESTWGTSNIATVANNFFGLHTTSADTPKRGQGFPPGTTENGVYHSLSDGYVYAFNSSTGFADSGQKFVDLKGSLVGDVQNPNDFANILHQNGYGVGNADFTTLLEGTIRSVQLRLLDCFK